LKKVTSHAQHISQTKTAPKRHAPFHAQTDNCFFSKPITLFRLAMSFSWRSARSVATMKFLPITNLETASSFVPPLPKTARLAEWFSTSNTPCSNPSKRDCFRAASNRLMNQIGGLGDERTIKVPKSGSMWIAKHEIRVRFFFTRATITTARCLPFFRNSKRQTWTHFALCLTTSIGKNSALCATDDFYFRNAHWNSASCLTSFVSMRSTHCSLSISETSPFRHTLFERSLWNR